MISCFDSYNASYSSRSRNLPGTPLGLGLVDDGPETTRLSSSSVGSMMGAQLQKLTTSVNIWGNLGGPVPPAPLAHESLPHF